MKRLRLDRWRLFPPGRACWVVAGLAALGATLWFVGASTARRETFTRAPWAGVEQRCHHRLRFWLDQCQADARPLIAAGRYVLDADPTSPPAPAYDTAATNLAARSSALPTNSAANAPKAYRDDNDPRNRSS